MLRRVAHRLLLALSRPFVDLGRGERAVFFGVAILHVVAITWGLPSSDAWDVDGIAPRDFLPGVIETFTPGKYFTYPPLHLGLLSLITLPFSAAAIARSPSLAQADVVATFIGVPTMTALSLAARIVNCLMSLGIVLVLGKLGATIFGPRARIWVIAFAGVEVAGTYYAHTSNLDIPALFWSSLALLVLARAVKGDEPKRLRQVALLAACAISSKDQAYAMFAVTMPSVIVAWALVARMRSGSARAIVREALLCAVITIGVVLVVDGALFNPSGFAARLRFLTGHASQDYAMYSRDTAGRISVVRDAILFLDRHYPVAIAPLVVLGMVGAFVRSKGNDRVAAAIPLLAIVSFTLAFNCVARRIEERFMMPQMQLYAVYAGGAVAMLLDAAGPRVVIAWVVRLGAAACVLAGVRLTACMLATMIGDPRYIAERYLSENVRPGDLVEVYGNNVYLPRFPPAARVERVGTNPPAARSPMPNIVERQDRLSAVAERNPRFVVVSMGYAWRFLHRPPSEQEKGHVLPAAQAAILADEDSTSYVRRLFAGEAGYKIAYHCFYPGHGALLPPRHLHASLASDVYVFERR
ncbi:MAG: hypothetical protein JST00_14725 [Deltaproteobacteria bacterium]|nr:hypothetical protein [Deltaproteobacteria bacterium]